MLTFVHAFTHTHAHTHTHIQAPHTLSSHCRCRCTLRSAVSHCGVSHYTVVHCADDRCASPAAPSSTAPSSPVLLFASMSRRHHQVGGTINVGRDRGRAKRTCSRAERGVQQNFGAGDVAGCKFSGTGTYREQQVAMPTPGNSTTLRRLQGCLDGADDRKLANSKISILIRRTNKSLKIGTPPWHSPSQKNTIGAI